VTRHSEGDEMKYSENMTKEELTQFMAEIDALDAAYAAAAEHDAKIQGEMPEEWEDEMELLRKAALNGGRP
jgi:hypothetical protein